MTDSMSVSEPTIMRTFGRILEDSASVNDSLTILRTRYRSVDDSMSVSDLVGLRGKLTIETRNNTLIPGAVYAVTPNPFTGLGSLTVTDGLSPDSDLSNNGSISLSDVLFGSYKLNQTQAPSGYVSITKKGLVTVHGTNVNALMKFVVVTNATDLLNSSVIDIDNVHVDNAQFATLLSPIKLTKVKDGIQTPITKVHDLPAPKFVGKNNTIGITNATKSQYSLLYKSLAELAPNESPDTVINAFRLNATDVGNSTSLSYVGVLASTAQSTVYGQYLATQPVEQFNCGQRYIYSLDDTLVPTYGGIKKVDFTVFENGTCPGTLDYITYEVSSKPPIESGIPSISETDPLQETLLYINARFPSELVNGTGIDFDNSTNIESYTFTVFAPKPQTNNIDDLTVYTFDESLDAWTKSGITVMSRNEVTSGTHAGKVQVEFEVEHTSKFTIGGKKLPASAGSGSSASPGHGKVGVGPASVGAGAGSASGTTSEKPVRPSSTTNIDSVYYNVCDDNIVKVMISGGLFPSNVVLQTKHSGIIPAKLADYQPYAMDNQYSDVHRYVYEASISPNETFFVVSANGESSISNTSIQIINCEGNVYLVKEDPYSKPQIFDFKLEVDGQDRLVTSSNSYEYLEEPTSITISALIDNAQSELRRAELRLITMGDADIERNYTGLKMKIEDLSGISNTTSRVFITVPASLLKSPATEFWIHAINADGKINDSEHLYLGLIPNDIDLNNVDAKLEMDMQTIKPQGTTLKPHAYLHNKESTSMYGLMTLLVDGKPVDAVPYLFKPGFNDVELSWVIPKNASRLDYNISARVDLYGNGSTTNTGVLNTFVRTQSKQLDSVTELDLIRNEHGDVVARPSLIYASNNHDNDLRFRVVSPQGVCVIGSDSSCLVSSSTYGNRGDLTSVQIGDQIYRIKYSGADSPLERFSITSFDPITGDWLIQLESNDTIISYAEAVHEVIIKIKYRAESSVITTLN
ncbi:prealbumin-like fold domain-containing protein [Nitrosopumilus sp. b1]|uniref:prealbumin-like fold domain-containing protein n=1 Tax=Nitrosopumilus sp. b1 TaxID=2109907 RepID=UPI001C7161F5|nr:prealbumin-like fold domain-containing protein [Nitrosopumilus sp. b1]